jgi:dihydropteroate synthase
MVELVGILNVTPDSFSDGNLFLDPRKAVQRVGQLFSEGASIVDIGAESTRPGAKHLTPEQEYTRLEPVLDKVIALYPGKISIDTYHPQTAEKVLAQGKVIINDVTGMNNPAMVALVARFQVRCVISHLRGLDVQQVHGGELINDINIIKEDLLKKAMELQSVGVNHEDIILDPGIGFGKTNELNMKLLRFAELVPDYQVMIGYSRKRFLGENRMELAPNLEAGRIAIDSGARYLRVHDVLGHQQLLN